MPIHYFGQARGSEERKYLGRLTLHRGSDGSIVQHHHTFGRAQLRHGPFELESFVNAGAHKRFYLSFSEGSQHAAPKSAHETFSPGEAHPVAFVGASIQHLN